MADITNIDNHRPHRVCEVICVKCRFRCVAVAPAETPLKDYECGGCGKTGFIINTGQEMQ